MADFQAQLAGKDFKGLIKAVMAFPSVGSFAGSEMVSLRVKDGQAVASTFGVVLSKARVPASGDFPLIAVDERALEGFVGVLSDTVKVTVTTNEKLVWFRAGRRETTVPYKAGVVHTLPKPKDAGEQFAVSKEIALKVKYLSDIAFGDTSKPELCAVMLSGDGRAMAVNQKAVATLTLASNGISRVALPIPMAKILNENDQVYISDKETLIKSGIAWYCMPSPVRAQKEFPVDAVTGFGKLAQELVAECSGQHFVNALQECNTCLSQLARTEIVLKISAAKDRLELSAENGGAKFRTQVKAGIQKEIAILTPLEELLHAVAFLEPEKNLTLSVGTKNNETFLSFNGGWLMLPAWRK